MKKGLILEGGAMRGLFTAGVMDVLMENGIEFDGAVGVSAGAAFGVNYKSKQIGRVLRYNTKFARFIILPSEILRPIHFCASVTLRSCNANCGTILSVMEIISDIDGIILTKR